MEEMVTLLMSQSILIDHCKQRMADIEIANQSLPKRLDQYHDQLLESFVENFKIFRSINFYTKSTQ